MLKSEQFEDWEESVVDFEKALVLGYENKAANLLRVAEARFRIGDIEGACAACDQGIGIDSTNSELQKLKVMIQGSREG